MLGLHHDPIIAIATAPGRGAVGIVRVSGKSLKAFAKEICARDLTPRQATYLPLKDAQGQVIDQVLALYFGGPNSYTGEDVLELQCHGGPVVLQLIQARCLELSSSLPHLRLAQPGEFTQRAFMNHKLDLAQAEAVADLIDASTEAAARSAGRSLHGAFSKEIAQLREQLVQLRMLVEATLDFPEEEIDFLQQADASGQLHRLQAQLKAVMQKTKQGALLREGIRVVIAGQPNAGKSSLLNALAGAELAIVTPIAGTTRDIVQQTIQIEGVPVHVVDTAGLRDSPQIDEVERIGIARAWDQIALADAVLFVHDWPRSEQTEYAQADEQIAANLAEMLHDKVPVLHIWNKADVLQDNQTSQPEGFILSAQTGQGLDALRSQLLQLVGWEKSQPEGVFMARQRHVQALTQMQEHLQISEQWLDGAVLALDLLAEELRLAQNELNSITGEFTSDDLLGVIFSSFCIGK
jgi:tRNA modification GTPase